MAARIGVLVALVGAALATAGAANAADLIVLAPDKAIISGSVTYTHVYVGGGATLDLAGDTIINAADVYFASGARLVTCFSPPTSEGACGAGRSLAITSSGQITIGTAINLQGGGGSPRPGGTLALQGTSISVSGGINTSGSMGGASGSVSIASSGAVSVSSTSAFAPAITSPGAPVSIHGTSVSLSGDVNTAGSDGNIPTAGPIDLEASGPLSVFGGVLAEGKDGTGGSGGTVTLRGSDIRVGSIDASAGSGSAGPPGYAASIDALGSTSLTVSGLVDARGASGPSGFGATPGANIRLASGGTVVTGNVTAQGADADSAPPSAAGSILIQGAGVATGSLYAFGGQRTTTQGIGGAGNNIVIGSTGPVSIGDADAAGGNSNGIAGGSPGGSIAINGTGVITSLLTTLPGNAGATGPGGNAGNVTVTGSTMVSVLGGVSASGGNAGSGPAPYPGGNGGTVQLHAAAGALSLPGPLNSSGGNGGGAPAGAKGGPGGAAGPIDLVGTPIDPIAGITSEGGDGGTGGGNGLNGVGGPGGSLHAWSETNIYQGLRAVSTAGGSGAPPGVDGVQLLDSGPTGLSVDANGLLSWTSQSPYADGFDIFRSVAGAPSTIALQTKQMSHVADPVQQPLCVAVSYAVAAYKTAVGWTSPTTPVVTYTRQPSTTQKCTDAPSVTQAVKSIVVKASGLAKNKGFSFKVKTNGMGAITATATTKGQKKAISSAVVTAAKAGTYTVTLKLNPKLKLKYKTVKKRQVATITVKLAAAAPTGTASSTITVAVEVRK